MKKVDNNHRPLVYGTKDGQFLHVSQVQRGLNCGCRCPSCNSRLVAKKGKIMIGHFAHEGGETCIAAYETQMHILAKQIISESITIRLPPQISTIYSERHQGYFRYPSSSKVGDWVAIECVREEFRLGDIVPDLIIEHDGGKELLIEIFVTHKVDDEKIEKIKRLDIPTLEIDLSDYVFDELDSIENLRKLIINNTSNKKWLFVRDYEARSKKMSRFIQFRVIRTLQDWYSQCPRKMIVKRPDDKSICPCSICPYRLIGANEDSFPTTYVCIGDHGIISEEDLEKRLLEGIESILDEDPSKRCSCGGKYVVRRGRFGLFWGCTNYPDCHSTKTEECMFHDECDYIRSKKHFCCPKCGSELEKGIRIKEGTPVYCVSSQCEYEIII